MNKILPFIKKNTVTVIAFFAAAVTAFIVPRPHKPFSRADKALQCPVLRFQFRIPDCSYGLNAHYYVKIPARAGNFFILLRKTPYSRFANS